MGRFDVGGFMPVKRASFEAASLRSSTVSWSPLARIDA